MNCPVDEVPGYKRTGLKLRAGLPIDFLKKLFGDGADESDTAKIDSQSAGAQIRSHRLPSPVHFDKPGTSDSAFQLDGDDFRIFKN
jgi:hypothetical protein